MICWLEQMGRGCTRGFPHTSMPSCCKVSFMAGLKKKSPSRIGGPKSTLLWLVDLKETNKRWLQDFKSRSQGTSVKISTFDCFLFFEQCRLFFFFAQWMWYFFLKNMVYEEHRWSLSMTCASQAARLVLDAFAQKWAGDAQQNMRNDFVPTCRIELGRCTMYNKRGTCKVHETGFAYDQLK